MWGQNELTGQRDIMKQDVVDHCGLIQLAIFDYSLYIYGSKYSQVCGGLTPELPVRHNLKSV